MNPFKGYDWEELIEFWGIKIPDDEFPDFDGEYPDADKMEKYETKDGHLSYSAWWQNEASDEYKRYIKEFGKWEKDTDKIKRKAIMDYIWASHGTDREHKVASELQMFIDALMVQSDGHDYQTPVWSALLDIESNYTLFQFVGYLLPAMWA